MFCHINNVEEFTYDGEPLVWVDGDTEEAGVGVDQLVDVADNGVPEDTSVSEECEAGHILGAVKLGRIDLADDLLLVYLDLSINIDRHLISILVLDETLEISSVGFVWDPEGLLGVIGLGLVLVLDLQADGQPGGGVGVRSGCLFDVSRHL